MSNHEEFKQLYKTYINGKHWLSKQKQEGKDVTQHELDFDARVVKPLHAVWHRLTKDEQEFWLKIKMIVQVFDGRIL